MLASLLLALIAPVLTSLPQPPPERAAVWPLDPRPVVARGLELPSMEWGAGHRGVDLMATDGAAVRAAVGGTVTFTGSVAGVPIVVVSHGETRTTYEPVVASVAAGSQVEAGSIIGALQLADSHCFPSACLHWGLLRGDEYLDPLSLLGPRTVRLLPLEPG